MCLVIDEFTHRGDDYNLHPLVAEDDIIVYKVLMRPAWSSEDLKPTDTDAYVTPFREMPIKFVGGKFEYIRDMKCVHDIGMEVTVITEGCHSYRECYWAEYVVNRCNTRGYKSGTHRVMTVHGAIIPKGSKFYIGSNDNNLVSDRLIIFSEGIVPDHGIPCSEYFIKYINNLDRVIPLWPVSSS